MLVSESYSLRGFRNHCYHVNITIVEFVSLLSHIIKQKSVIGTRRRDGRGLGVPVV